MTNLRKVTEEYVTNNPGCCSCNVYSFHHYFTAGFHKAIEVLNENEWHGCSAADFLKQWAKQEVKDE